MRADLTACIQLYMLLGDNRKGHPYLVKYSEQNSGVSRANLVHITWLAEHHTLAPLTKKQVQQRSKERC